MASKRAIYKALHDLTSTLLEKMVDSNNRTVWCTNRLTTETERSGIFVFITYSTKMADAVQDALQKAGLLPAQDLGGLGDPPPNTLFSESIGTADANDGSVVSVQMVEGLAITSVDREAAVTALQEDGELVRAWIRTGVRKGLFNDDLERVAMVVATARMEGRRLPR